MGIQLELILLVISVLFFVCILAGRAGYKLGVPALLLFLGVGMLFGSDGLGSYIGLDGMGVKLDIGVVQGIGTIALCIILFSGGMDTKMNDIKPVVAQGVMLATFGVLLTTVFTGLIVWFLFDFVYAHTISQASGKGVGLLTSFLLAATMSSTDSASVFSILRSKGLHLKRNLRPMLELESGSNDPMAYILTLTLIGVVQGQYNTSVMGIIGLILMQLVIGVAVGFLLGKGLVWLMNRIEIGNDSLYPILIFTCCIFIFAVTYFVRGNSYLAVYIGGLVIGNSKFVHKRSTMSFFDGLSWLSQLVMFLALGLLVKPHELIPVAVPGLIISIAMIFLTRPLSVFITLLPFRKMHLNDKTFVSWVGLRGAVPIIFAIMTLAADIQYSRLIFNIVFFCTLVSLIVQGTSLPMMAKLLHVSHIPDEFKKPKHFDVELPEDAKSAMSEIEITEKVLEHGKLLMDMGMPDNTLVIMIKRNDNFFVPTGKTELKLHDKLLVITDNKKTLEETYKKLSINHKA